MAHVQNRISFKVPFQLPKLPRTYYWGNEEPNTERRRQLQEFLRQLFYQPEILSDAEESLLRFLCMPKAAKAAIRFLAAPEKSKTKQLDLLLLTEPENIFYLTGYQTVGEPEIQALIIPAAGEPSLEVLGSLSQSCRLGLELQSRRLFARHLRRLEAKLAGWTLCDASRLVPEQRLVKSAAELAVLRRAAQVCAAGMRAGQAARCGMAETEIAGRVYAAMAQEGGEYPAYPPFVCVGQNGCLGHYTGSGGSLLREGELLFLEIGGCYERYHAAMMRSCYVGTKLPAVLASAETAVAKAMETAMAAMKPGVLAKEVDAKARAGLGSLGALCTMSLRSGYSIGLGFYTDWGEAQFFKMDPGSDQVFQEGMVIHLIPWVQVQGHGGVGLSDTVLVTKGGAKSLFDCPDLPRRIHLIPPPAHRPFGPEEARKVRCVLGLEATPLVKISDGFPGLAAVYVKDESKRMGLQAFKVVGGAYAMLRFMCKRLAQPVPETSDHVKAIQDLYQERFGATTFVTCTDGNHGRGVAWAAKKFGQRAVVYMPKGSASQRLQHVRDLGAEAEITENYDDTVELAFRQGREKGWVVLQDTTAPGYTEIPEWIMQGYTAMVDESLDESSAMPKPSHVLLQMGVGSMAAAVVGYFTARFGESCPKFLVIEPWNAACGFASARAGELQSVGGDLETMVAGLACGVPSSLAWPILWENCSAFLRFRDDLAGNGMRLLHRYGLEAGECGGAGAGVLQYLMQSSSCASLREDEGATDPANYKQQLALPDVEGSGLLEVALGKSQSLYETTSEPEGFRPLQDPKVESVLLAVLQDTGIQRPKETILVCELLSRSFRSASASTPSGAPGDSETPEPEPAEPASAAALRRAQEVRALLKLLRPADVAESASEAVEECHADSGANVAEKPGAPEVRISARKALLTLACAHRGAFSATLLEFFQDPGAISELLAAGAESGEQGQRLVVELLVRGFDSPVVQRFADPVLVADRSFRWDLASAADPARRKRLLNQLFMSRDAFVRITVGLLLAALLCQDGYGEAAQAEAGIAAVSEDSRAFDMSCSTTAASGDRHVEPSAASGSGSGSFAAGLGRGRLLALALSSRSDSSLASCQQLRSPSASAAGTTESRHPDGDSRTTSSSEAG
eukprot:s1035_g4.t2